MYGSIYILNARKYKLIYNESTSVVTWGKRSRGRHEKEIAKGQEETLGSDRCVHSLDCGDGFTSVKMYEIVHFKRVQ